MRAFSVYLAIVAAATLHAGPSIHHEAKLVDSNHVTNLKMMPANMVKTTPALFVQAQEAEAKAEATSEAKPVAESADATQDAKPAAVEEKAAEPAEAEAAPAASDSEPVGEENEAAAVAGQEHSDLMAIACASSWDLENMMRCGQWPDRASLAGTWKGVACCSPNCSAIEMTRCFSGGCGCGPMIEQSTYVDCSRCLFKKRTRVTTEYVQLACGRLLARTVSRTGLLGARNVGYVVYEKTEAGPENAAVQEPTPAGEKPSEDESSDEMGDSIVEDAEKAGSKPEEDKEASDQ